MSYPFTVPSVKIYAGDTSTFDDYTITEAGVPLDLTTEGWVSYTAHWRRHVSSTAYINLSVDSSDADVGVIRISASPTQTRAMKGSGVFDVQAVDGTGVVQTLFQGATIYEADVTR